MDSDKSRCALVVLLAVVAGLSTVHVHAAPQFSEIETLVMPPVDHDALLAEDAASAGPGVPLRYAISLPVILDPFTNGR